MKVPKSTDISVVDELEKVGLERFRETGILTTHTHFSSRLISTVFHLFIPHLLFTISAVLSLPTLVFCLQLHSCVLHIYNWFSPHLVSGLLFPLLATAHLSFLSAVYKIFQCFQVHLTKKSNQINKTVFIPQCSITFPHW